MIGYDEVMKIPTTHVDTVAPLAMEVLRRKRDAPLFLSVGFFETHREFLGPGSLRDVHYSKPPNNLPDCPEVRADVAAFKASARSLDHGVGMVLNQLDASGLARHADHLHDRPRDAVPGREGDAVRPRPGRDADPARTGAVRRRARDRRAGLAHRHLPDGVRVRGDRAPAVPARRLAAAAAARRARRACARRSSRARPGMRHTSPSARSAPSATSTSAAGASAARRCSRTPTTAPARTCCWRPAGPSGRSPKNSFMTSLFDPNEANNLLEDPALRGGARGSARAPGAVDARHRRSAARRPRRPAAGRGNQPPRPAVGERTDEHGSSSAQNLVQAGSQASAPAQEVHERAGRALGLVVPHEVPGAVEDRELGAGELLVEALGHRARRRSDPRCPTGSARAASSAATRPS